MNWGALIENQINKAKAEGQLKGLKGEGKPLPRRSAGDVVSAGLDIMAEAGVLPNEIVLKKAIEAQQAVLSKITDESVRKEEMSKLADLQMRLSIEQEARRKFFRTS